MLARFPTGFGAGGKKIHNNKNNNKNKMIINKNKQKGKKEEGARMPKDQLWPILISEVVA